MSEFSAEELRKAEDEAGRGQYADNAEDCSKERAVDIACGYFDKFAGNKREKHLQKLNADEYELTFYAVSAELGTELFGVTRGAHDFWANRERSEGEERDEHQKRYYEI